MFDLFDELSEIGFVILCGDFNIDIKNKCSSLKLKFFMEIIYERNFSSLFLFDIYFMF